MVTDIQEPERVRYVGRTVVGLENRKRSHWYQSQTGRGAFQRWLVSRRNRTEDVIFREIDRADDVLNLNRKEREWIAYYRERGQADLNLTDGGDGGWGRIMSPESQEKHRLSVPRGDSHPLRKLGSSDVSEIRSLRSETYIRNIDLAARYGVSRGTIADVLNNKLWVDPEFDPASIIPNDRTGERARNRKLSRDAVDEIRSIRLERWVRTSDLAQRFGVSVDMIRLILKNRNWYDPEFHPENLATRGTTP